MLFLASTVIFQVENGTPGGVVPETLQAVVYSIGFMGGAPVETVQVVGGRVEVAEPEDALQVGLEVIYKGASFFSPPVEPGGTGKVLIYEPGGSSESLQVASYNLAFFMGDSEKITVAEAVHLWNPQKRVVEEPGVFKLVLPSGRENFQFMGLEEDYVLTGDTLYIMASLPPGTTSFGLSYELKPPVKLVRDVKAGEFKVLADTGLYISGKNLVKTGTESMAGFPMVGYAARDPQKPVELVAKIGKPKNWTTPILIALGALLVLGLAFWGASRAGGRKSLLAQLGQLELSKERGEISEEEYQARRRELLEKLITAEKKSEEERGGEEES